ncbi:MAG: tetratricopeptide repeat protein [Chloroflexota bacterium]|nr:tetratricopeptide repeat protein [Chloroflexota bacterium]
MNNEKRGARVIALNRWHGTTDDELVSAQILQSQASQKSEQAESEIAVPNADLEILHAFDVANEYEQLREAAEHILDLNPGSSYALAYYARALQRLGYLSEATVANDQALLLDTSVPLAWINRSGVQLLQSKFVDALRSATRAIELAPTDARAWINYGLAWLNHNRLVNALDAFTRGLECQPDSILALTLKGEVLHRLRRMRELADLMQIAVRIAPHDRDANMLLLHAYRALGEHGHVVEIAEDLLPGEAEHPFIWEQYARALRGLGRFNEADQALDRLLEFVPDDVRFWTMKADTLYRLELYAESAEIVDAALSIDADYRPAIRLYKKLMRQGK